MSLPVALLPLAGGVALVAWLTVLVVIRAAPVSPAAALPARLSRLFADGAGLGRWVGVLILLGAWGAAATHPPAIVDARAYWGADLGNLYTGIVNEVGTFPYSPVAGIIAEPFGILPWPVFYALWTGLNLALLAWLLGPPAAALTLAFPPVHHAIWIGNIDMLLAASIVAGVRFPAAWAFPLLTKVTSGVGVLWHVGRRQWRALGVALGLTLALALLSFAVAPGLWFDWVELLRASGAAEPPRTLLPLPLEARLGLATAVALFAGFAAAPWLLPFAVVLAQPVFWTAGLSILVAAVPLARPLRASTIAA